MRFDPIACPECGQLAKGALDWVPGCSIFLYPDDLSDDSDASDVQASLNAGGVLEYSGETKMYWDGSETETDDQGRVKLICSDGHEWWATDLDRDPPKDAKPETKPQFRGIQLEQPTPDN